MKTVIVTGSAGLIGSEASKFFHQQEFRVIGIDNNMRAYFFGEGASTLWNKQKLEDGFPNYVHHAADIRDFTAIETIFKIDLPVNSARIKRVNGICMFHDCSKAKKELGYNPRPIDDALRIMLKE